MQWLTLLASTSASTKNLVQKRTKEKFPVDPVTSSEPALDKKEQSPAVKMELPRPDAAHTEALLPPSAETENCATGLCCRGQTESSAASSRMKRWPHSVLQGHTHLSRRLPKV